VSIPDSAGTPSLTTVAVGFSSMILWWVRVLNEFEVSGEYENHDLCGISLNMT
jgi:hypothetical protein